MVLMRANEDIGGDSHRCYPCLSFMIITREWKLVVFIGNNCIFPAEPSRRENYFSTYVYTSSQLLWQASWAITKI